mmetsp:Transcript_20053/g.47336  ORF Transcript_20053/g.47336 Transcript_20053/m.47336 type:complete len:233 (-) Transcript_20053:61-759(-)
MTTTRAKTTPTAMRPIAQSSSPPESVVMADPSESSKRPPEGGGEGGEGGGEGGGASSVIAPMVTSAFTSTSAPAALAAALPMREISAGVIFGKPPTREVARMAAKTTTEPGRSVRITVDASTPRLEARLSLKALLSKLATSPLTFISRESPIIVRAPGECGGEGGNGGSSGGGCEGGAGGDGGSTYFSRQTKGRRKEGSAAAQYPLVRKPVTEPALTTCMMAPTVVPPSSDS